MAGTTKTVKRQWGLDSQSGGPTKYDAFKALYDEHNNVITDLETIRAQLESLRSILLSGPLGSAAPGLAIGTTSKKEVKIANAVTLLVQGAPATVTAQEVGFTATTHDIAADKASYYALSADSQGTVVITKGADAAPGSAAKPAVPDGDTILGFVLIETDGTSGDVFDATTDDLDAAKLTVTYEDVVQTIPSAQAASALVGASLTTEESGD